MNLEQILEGEKKCSLYELVSDISCRQKSIVSAAKKYKISGKIRKNKLANFVSRKRAEQSNNLTKLQECLSKISSYFSDLEKEIESYLEIKTPENFYDSLLTKMELIRKNGFDWFGNTDKFDELYSFFTNKNSYSQKLREDGLYMAMDFLLNAKKNTEKIRNSTKRAYDVFLVKDKGTLSFFNGLRRSLKWERDCTNSIQTNFRQDNNWFFLRASSYFKNMFYRAGDTVKSLISRGLGYSKTKRLNPFLTDAELIKIARTETKGCKTIYTKSKAIFDWITANIQYDDIQGSRIVNKIPYKIKNSSEVLYFKKGIDVEKAILYVAMSRAAGLTAHLAQIENDNLSERISDCCAAVLHKGSNILVDLGYRKIHSDFKKYRVLSDEEAVEQYNFKRKEQTKATKKKSRFKRYAAAGLGGALLLGICSYLSVDESHQTLSETNPMIDMSKIDKNYFLTISETGIENQIPFLINQKLVRIVEQETDKCNSELEKAEAIFNWVKSNVDYNKGKTGYRNSLEVLSQKKGICGEMAFLYVTMARSAGLESNYVSVKVDRNGKAVSHACAVVEIDGKKIFVDPAYRTFDINHQEVKIRSDKEANKYYQALNRNVLRIRLKRKK